MRQNRWITARLLAMGLMGAMLVAPAAAQFSDSYKFLKAVRDRDGTEVTKVVDQPGSTMINVRGDDGDGALHIVTKRRDATWLTFLLAKGAKPDLRNSDGNTALGIASQIGFAEGVAVLLDRGAGVNIANGQGETPLILAVQARDPGIVRQLLAAGANPALTDRASGMSARDYAVRDRRSAAIVKQIDEARPVKPRGPIAGPKL
ncbi:ankyrin repeat domain-containing protein [Sphingomonas solaris]|uniref:Ankyrin repeat domain-containing protein n=2 Tax=Alterirhizorhabdus solaris TaxID=2529389 RepID=A0A558R3E9_9SPHN|nr:ankyrin repeat domain-containing protein [Sphingomonas solaris]